MSSGPKGKHNPDRTAVRHGHEDGAVTLGGRRVEVQPAADADRGRRARGAAGDATSTSPIVIRSPAWCWSGCSPASRPAGTGARRSRSARRSSRGAVDVEVGSVAARSWSGPATRSGRADEPASSADLRLAVMMLDGLELKGRTMIVALGITTEGVKIPLGLWEGSDRERDGRDRAAVRSRRPRPGSRAGDAVRDRRLQGALNAVANFEFERLIDRIRRLREKESVVMCSTQRTDGVSSRLRGRVRGAGQPRGGSGARAVRRRTRCGRCRPSSLCRSGRRGGMSTWRWSSRMGCRCRSARRCSRSGWRRR